MDVTLKELVPSDKPKLILNAYTVVKTTTPVGSLKLLKYGTVLDSELFSRLFGDV